MNKPARQNVAARYVMLQYSKLVCFSLENIFILI